MISAKCQYGINLPFNILFCEWRSVAQKDWGADFRKLSAGAALVGLTLWLDHMQVCA
jgi:hypothetical protein